MGRGPENLQVFIHGETILVKAKGLWSPSELIFMSFIEKNNLLPEFYKQFLHKAFPLVEEILSKYMKVKVIDININGYPDYNIANATIILNLNFERELKKLDR